MVLVNLNTRKGIVNLFSDYILSKIGSSTKTIIQVTDCDSFFVVNGKTEKKEPINLTEITKSFEKEFSTIIGNKKINTIDLIKYDSEPESNKNIWFTFFYDNNIVYLKKMIENDFDVDPLQVSSEFPFGYSKKIDRNKLYYSEYICYQLFSVITSNTVKFKFSTDILDESPNIEIIGDSRFDLSVIKSMVLDVFDFDLNVFEGTIKDYNIMRDLTDPFESKPWLKFDMKKDMWIF